MNLLIWTRIDSHFSRQTVLFLFRSSVLWSNSQLLESGHRISIFNCDYPKRKIWHFRRYQTNLNSYFSGKLTCMWGMCLKTKATREIYSQEFSLWNEQLPDLTLWCSCCQRQNRREKGIKAQPAKIMADNSSTNKEKYIWSLCKNQELPVFYPTQ